MYDQDDDKFIRYYEEDGLATNEFNGFSYHMGKDGDIYFVGFANVKNGIIDFSETRQSSLENEYENLKLYDIEENDILFPPITRRILNIKKIDTVDRTKKMIYSYRVVYIRVNPNKYNAKFLYHILSQENYKEKLINEAYTNGSYALTYQISIEKLKEFKIPDVSVEEQNKIVEKEIEINKQIEELKNKKISLYNEIL